MEKIKFNNKEEYEKYKTNYLIGGFCCFGFYNKPTHYPCILVWYHYDGGEDESILGEYIYKEDFD